MKYHWFPKKKFTDFEHVEVLSRKDEVPVCRGDIFFAYSSWDVLIARTFAPHAEERRVIALVQEYEPIFLENNSLHFLSNSSYCYDDVYPIYNSNFLCEFFRRERLGPFRNIDAKLGKDYSVFEHVITPMALGDLGQHERKTLFFYARPEPHAGRNLFEVGIIALRRLLARHPELSDWRFVGIGALSNGLSIDLAENVSMKIFAKLPVEEYMGLMNEVDVCLSLMWAPHPSVVPFELLQTGALVVTNSYVNRSSLELGAISPNLIPASPSLEGIVGALEIAVKRVADVDYRQNGVVRVGANSWAEAFAGVHLNLVEAGVF